MILMTHAMVKDFLLEANAQLRKIKYMCPQNLNKPHTKSLNHKNNLLWVGIVYYFPTVMQSEKIGK